MVSFLNKATELTDQKMLPGEPENVADKTHGPGTGHILNRGQSSNPTPQPALDQEKTISAA